MTDREQIPLPTSLSEVYQQWETSVPETASVADELCSKIDEFDFDEPDLTTALELVRWEADRERHDRVALFLLVLATCVSRKRGSVRLRIHGGDQSFAHRLNSLFPGVMEEVERLRSLFDGGWPDVANQLQSLLGDPSTLCIAGHGNETVPLIIEGDHCYHQRARSEEVRLAREIRGRLVEEDFDPFSGEPYGADSLADALEMIQSETAFNLTSEQQYGVLTAICGPLSVITGGPGTGKTFIVLTILRLLSRLGVDPGEVAVAAPTGKAANRLGETIQENLQVEEFSWDASLARDLKDPSTIHRLLKYSEKRGHFYHHRHRPLPYRYVIVDEASMIDLTLMERLMAAVSADARLCLLGDAHQLPAVESGAVFRDLVPESVRTDVAWRSLAPDPLAENSDNTTDPLSGQAIRLEKNFRLEEDGEGANNLREVSESLKQGGDELTLRHEKDASGSATEVLTRPALHEIQFSGVEHVSLPGEQTNNSNSPGERRAFQKILRHWYDCWFNSVVSGRGDGPSSDEVIQFKSGSPARETDRDRLDEWFQYYDRFQLLSVTRRTPRGSRFINDYLHRCHRDRRSQEGLETDFSRQFEPGEPVMINQNDYERGLFNGDAGIVLRVHRESSSEPRPMVVFPGLQGYRAFALGPLHSRLNHAFALTIHKSQGSEYGSVGVVLPGQKVPMLTRELLYTGVTRARQSVIFYGSWSMLQEGARERDQRNSGLLERIQGEESTG